MDETHLPDQTTLAVDGAAQLSRSAEAALRLLADGKAEAVPAGSSAALIAHDLAARRADGRIAITDAGRAFLARRAHAGSSAIDPFRAQHLTLIDVSCSAPDARQRLKPDAPGVLADAAESPLVWLARRKGRDGRPLIDQTQLMAGERLRGDFTRAQMMPRVTSRWDGPLGRERRGSGGAGFGFTDVAIAARQRVRHALEYAGPEVAGLLLDVCCFLKRLDDVERERRWPARSGKVVLQLALDRLARHYGLAALARGPAYAALTAWSDDPSPPRR